MTTGTNTIDVPIRSAGQQSEAPRLQRIAARATVLDCGFYFGPDFGCGFGFFVLFSSLGFSSYLPFPSEVRVRFQSIRHMTPGRNEIGVPVRHGNIDFGSWVSFLALILARFGFMDWYFP